MPTFTADWFSHNIPNWEHVFASLGWLRSSMHLQVLEVGSWEGQSACWLLENVCCAAESELFCIDTWNGAAQYGSDAQSWRMSEQEHNGKKLFQRFMDNVASTGQASKVTAFQQTSLMALAGLISTRLEAFDVVYIDGSHYPQDVLTDAVLAWRLMKNGAIMIMDDYEWGQVVKKPPEETPKKAIDSFLECFSQELHVLELGYQCIVQKHAVNR